MTIPSPSAAMSGFSARMVAFAPMSARRMLALGGIGLMIVGMLVGDIFAVFVLHQNAAKLGENLAAAAHAAMSGDTNAVSASFQSVGSLLENRGTKVDTHVHMIAFGYLALMLAVLQPWVALRESTLQRCFRDIHVLTQHTMVAPATYELTGRLLLGLDAETSML